MEPKTFVCATAAELDKWMQLMEDRKYKSSAQPLSPSHCALSYLVSTVAFGKSLSARAPSSPRHRRCVTAAVRPALEEGGAEEVPAPGSHLAVGGHAHPAHGAAGLHLRGARHQHPATGDNVCQTQLHGFISNLRGVFYC